MAIRKFLTAVVSGLALLLSTASTNANSAGSQGAFGQLLIESGLHLGLPGQFVALPPRAKAILPYEHALRHESGDLEIRFMVRPLNRIRIDYNDPHNATPEPNHLFPLLFESITNQLANGRDTPASTFPASQAMEKFNASWAAASAFEVDPEFSGGYHNALLVGMHKNDMADAYTLFLYNDHQRAKSLINESISIMQFVADSVPQ